MGYICCLFSLCLLILLMVEITSGADKNDKKAAPVKHQLTKSQLLPKGRKLTGNRQYKSQVHRKVSRKKISRKKPKLLKGGRTAKNKERMQQDMSAKDKSGISKGERKVNIKRRTLRVSHKNKRTKKVRNGIKPVRKAPTRIFKRKTARSKNQLRKKSKPVKAGYKTFKNKVARSEVTKKPIVHVEKTTSRYYAELRIKRQNITRFLEIVAGEKYRIYRKCDKEGPKIVPASYVKLHKGHIPEGYSDCRDEMNVVYEAVLDHSKASDTEKREMWNDFQGRISRNRGGRPNVCKQWRYGSDCI